MSIFYLKYMADFTDNSTTNWSIIEFGLNFYKDLNLNLGVSYYFLILLFLILTYSLFLSMMIGLNHFSH